jgi:hypothetical protein
MPRVSYSLMEIDMSAAFICRDCGDNKKSGGTFMFKHFVLWDITPCNPLKVNRGFGGSFTSTFKFEE